MHLPACGAFLSCLIWHCAACRHMQEQKRQFNKNAKLHTFSIGLKGSPDLAAAQKVADMIGTVHHGFTFSVQDGLDAVRDVVYHIESYEQIRAAVPMYILARRIKALGYKVRHPSMQRAHVVSLACLDLQAQDQFKFMWYASELIKPAARAAMSVRHQA